MGSPAGWSEVDDAESERVIHAALYAGANIFDTAANYGCGYSERVLGQALQDRLEAAVIVTKFGDRIPDINLDSPEATAVSLQPGDSGKWFKQKINEGRAG